MSSRLSPVAVVLLASLTSSFPVFAQPGAIAGTIRAANGQTPIEGVQVFVFDILGDAVGFATSGVDGTYLSSALNAGSYRLAAFVDGYVDEVYDDVPCELGICGNLSGATSVSVFAGVTTSPVDFDLSDPDQSSISGTVLEEGSSTPIEGAVVKARNVEIGDFVRETTTAADGSYQLGELPDGAHVVVAGTVTGRIDELYANKSCPFFGCDLALGDHADVTRGTPTTGVDFSLAGGGTISGDLLRSDTDAGVAAAPIGILIGGVGRILATTDGLGHYVASSGLPNATYRVWFPGDADVRSELFSNLPLPPGRPTTDGTAIVISGASSAVANLSAPPKPVFANDFETGGAGPWSQGSGIEVCDTDLCLEGAAAPSSTSCDPCVAQIVSAHPGCASSWDGVCVAALWATCHTLACW